MTRGALLAICDTLAGDDDKCVNVLNTAQFSSAASTRFLLEMFVSVLCVHHNFPVPKDLCTTHTTLIRWFVIYCMCPCSQEKECVCVCVVNVCLTNTVSVQTKAADSVGCPLVSVTVQEAVVSRRNGKINWTCHGLRLTNVGHLRGCEEGLSAGYSSLAFYYILRQHECLKGSKKLSSPL